MKVTTTPYKYQLEGSDFLFLHHYAVLGDEMGLGKSLQALLVIARAGGRVLILCPAYLKNNWEKEFRDHTDETDILVVKTKNDIKFMDNYKVVIINYEQIRHIDSDFNSFKSVVVDECQYLKSMSAQRTKTFHAYIKNTLPERLMLLSGTPIKNNAGEWYSLLLLCSYSPLKNNGIDIRDKFKTEWKFQTHFCLQNRMNIRGRVVTKFYGMKNKESLRTLLKGKYIRRTTDKVLDLPEMVRKDVLISFSNDKTMDKAWQDFNSGLNGAHVSTAKKESAIRKTVFTTSYVADLLDNDSGPIVVFSEHPAAVKEVFLSLQKKFRVRYIDGSVSSDDRGDIANMFQNGQLDVLVATIGSASTGLTLTKSNNLVFNDKAWTPADNAQAEKRIHRISQNKTAFVHTMLGSIVDSMINKNLEAKQEVLRNAL